MRAGMMTASNTTETRHCPNRRRLLSVRLLISSSNDSPTTAMTDIAIQAALDGKVDEWMERVTTSAFRLPFLKPRESMTSGRNSEQSLLRFFSFKEDKIWQAKQIFVKRTR